MTTRQTGRWNRLSSYKTVILTDECLAGTAVRYQSTDIVTFNGETVTLNTGGYFTVTTKRKMNQAANQFELGFSVHQHRRQWYVTTKAGCFAWPSEDTNVLTIERASGVLTDLDFATLAVAKAQGEKQRR